jgi:hypothetical protein
VKIEDRKAADLKPRICSSVISLKRSTKNLQLSTTTPADYPILGCQKQTDALQRKATFSITASAAISTDGGGMLEP